DPESDSQALTSCRRILKSLADALYPSRDEPVTGVDGKLHQVTDDAYVNRLWQFVAERVKGHAAGDLLLSEVTALGNRVENIYDLSSKGVHADPSHAEAVQCVLQTYLVIGDILRVADNDSAINADLDGPSTTVGDAAIPPLSY